MAVRPFVRRVLALVAILALSLSASPPPASGGPDRPAANRASLASRVSIFPVEDLRRGMRGHALTVVHGKRISSIGVKILGVQPDGIAPGIDFILIRVFGKVARANGGIVAGMSGSPVYIGQRLVGAIAFGFFGGDFFVGGVTPAKAMLDILDYPNRTSAAAWARTVRLSRSLREQAERRGGEGRMRQLALPLSVSGLLPHRLEVLQRSIDRAGLPFLVVGGGRAAAPRAGAKLDPLPPGSSYAAALSYGDLTATGTGTTTIRVGRKSVAFGHPLIFFFGGQVEYGLNGARVLTVVKNAFVPFKFPVIDLPHGTLTQDRLAGVAGLRGVFPDLTRVHADIANLDTGFRQAGTTRVARRFKFLPDLAFFALLVEADRAFDRIGDGSAQFVWKIRGTRGDGSDFVFRRRNLFDSEFDITIESLFEVLGNLFSIAENPFERVEITAVRLEGDLTQDRRVRDIDEVVVTSSSDPTPVTEGEVFAMPGDTLTIEVLLRKPFGDVTSEIMEVVVPDFACGSLSLVVRGGGGGFFDEFLFDEPENGVPSDEPQSFDDLLAQLDAAEHNNDLVAELAFFSEEEGTEDVVDRQLVTLEDVVRGSRFFDVFVDCGEEPPPEPEPEP